MLWYLPQDKPKEMLRNQVWFMWCKVCDDGGIWEIQAGASLPARRPLTHNEHSSEPRHGPTMGGYNLNTVIPSPSSSPTVIPCPSPKQDMDPQWGDIISIQLNQVIMDRGSQRNLITKGYCPSHLKFIFTTQTNYRRSKPKIHIWCCKQGWKFSFLNEI